MAIMFAICLFASLASAQTMLIDSFENGVDQWVLDDANSIHLNHAASTIGVTDGLASMEVEMDNGTGWGVLLNVDATNTPDLYNTFNTVAADPGAWLLEFDLTTTAETWANVGPPAVPPFQGLAQVNVALSSDAQFMQAGGVSGQIFQQEGLFNVTIPAGNFAPIQDSANFQLFLGAANVFEPGVGGGGETLGARYFFDNLRFTPAPPTVETTLFSWETPDDPGTPGVDERFEGWSDAGLNEDHANTHVHSISTIGATDGAHSLKVDNTLQDDFEGGPGFAFYWGSNVEWNADVNPDPDVQEIDPVIQAEVTDLIGKINGASAFAFDVHFSDPFDEGENQFAPLPGFVRFAVHVSDDQGAFFDEEGPALDGQPDADPEDTFEYVIPTNIMGDPNNGLILSEAGLNPDSTFLRIGLAVNSDGGIVAHLDNFRLISEAQPLAADFNGDGAVDELDLAQWEEDFGVNGDSDANGDGVSDGTDFVIYQREFGSTAVAQVTSISSELISVTVVPEPGALALALIAAAGVAACICSNGAAPQD